MRVGERSTRIRDGGGRELIRLTAGFLLAACPAAHARPRTVGPARIVCNAAFCEMGPSTRPTERVRVIVSDLPREEIARLRKCTGVAAPCIVTIEGDEQDKSTKLMATNIRWQQ